MCHIDVNSERTLAVVAEAPAGGVGRTADEPSILQFLEVMNRIVDPWGRKLAAARLAAQPFCRTTKQSFCRCAVR